MESVRSGWRFVLWYHLRSLTAAIRSSIGFADQYLIFEAPCGSRESRHRPGRRGDRRTLAEHVGRILAGEPNHARETPPTFLPARPISQSDLSALTERVRRGVIRWFRRCHLLDVAAAADMLTCENSGFSVDASTLVSTATRTFRSRRVRRGSSCGPDRRLVSHPLEQHAFRRLPLATGALSENCCVGRQRRSGEQPRASVLADSLAASEAQRPPLLVVGEEFDERGGKLLGILWRHEPAAAKPLEHLRKAAVRGEHHRGAGG